jgi:type I restriction enzyme M protein
VTRITQQNLESYLWGAAVLLRGTIDAGDYKQFIFPLLFYKRLCDVFDEETVTALRDSGGDEDFALFPENHRFQVPADAHWREIRKVNRDVGSSLQQAMRAIETANPDKLFGIFGDAQWTNKDRLSDAMLRDLIEHFSTLELTVANLPEDELGQGYEYLIKKFADDSGHTAAEFYTNRTVVHLMTEMLDVQPGESVYDPTCGSGGMLLSCIAHLRNQKKEWRNVKLCGQERNLMTSSIARMNCFLHGIEDFRIERGDTLAEPKLVEGDRLQRFDVVLANPPYSIKQWNREAFAADPWGRNLYGTPPPGRADYAFWQHILQSLKAKTGRCAILFPHGILFRKEEAEMRSKIIEADIIECILGLGANLFYNSPMEACVVICRTDKPKSRKGKILLINAINEVTRERAQSYLTDDHIEHIVQAYERFANEPGFARVVTREELRANEGNLSIPIYIAAAATGTKQDAKTGGSLVESIDDWRDSSANVARSLAQLLPAMAAPTRKDKSNPDWAELPLFDRSKWKRVRFGDVVKQMKEQVNPEADGVERYVAGEHMETENVHIRKWGMVGDGYLGPAFIRGFRKGQVLYGSRRTYLKKVAVAEWDGVTANTTFVIEAVEGKLLQELLPWLMLSERFTKHSVQESKGSTNPYINFPDIAKFEFDLPPLDQQRRIAEILWAVDSSMGANYGLESSLLEYRWSLLDSITHKYSESHALAPLDSAIEQGRPICYGILMPGLGVQNGIPVVKVRDFPDGYIREGDLLQTTPEIEAPYKRSRLKTGDLLISIRGTIGRMAEVPPALDGANITQDTARLSIAPEHNRGYLRAVLESRFVERQIQSRITGLAVKGINIGELRQIQIPLPSRSKQDEIAGKLSTISAAQNAAAANSVQVRSVMSASIENLLGGYSR